MKKKTISLTVVLVTLALLQGAPAFALMFSDDDVFNNSDWTGAIIYQAGPPVSFSAQQIPTGGNPDEYRQLQQSYGGTGSIITGNIFDSAIYNPAIQGAISQVTYSFDLVLFDGGDSGAVAYGGLLSQAGNFYIAGYEQTMTNGWVHHDLSSFSASDFWDVSGSGTLPDFSAGGAPITFGYYASNGTGGPSSTTTLSGIDNWSVSTTTVPEPSTMLLLGSGLIGLAGYGRKKFFRK